MRTAAAHISVADAAICFFNRDTHRRGQRGVSVGVDRRVGEAVRPQLAARRVDKAEAVLRQRDRALFRLLRDGEGHLIALVVHRAEFALIRDAAVDLDLHVLCHRRAVDSFRLLFSLAEQRRRTLHRHEGKQQQRHHKRQRAPEFFSLFHIEMLSFQIKLAELLFTAR